MAKIFQYALTRALAGTVLANASLDANDTDTVYVPQMKRELPKRKEIIDSLGKKQYDILIIGGGVVGAGCALEAATRGLKVALVEANDFASGSSSKSTKLLHGGFRDFSRSLKTLNISGLIRVRNSLKERSTLLQIAPHLNHTVPIMIPIHNFWQMPYYWLHLTLYNMLAPAGWRKFYYIDREEVLNIFPIMQQNELRGAYVVHENQHDDARMCLAIALTSARFGADICNYMKVVNFNNTKDDLVGVRVTDQLNGKSHNIRAKVVINATGAQVDSIRKLNDPNASALCTPSMGTHIVLPGYYCPEEVGVFDPKTRDGHPIFFLPWQGHTIVGTTDVTPADITLLRHPNPTESEVQFLLEGIKNYVNPKFEVRRCDVLSVWSGFRPLPSLLTGTNASKPQMDYIISVAPGKLITVVGGSWTTYRLMAEQAINTAVTEGDLKPERKNSVTTFCKLDGASGWSPHMYIRLVQDFGIEREVAQHLSNTYGTNAFRLVTRAEVTGKAWPITGKRLHSGFPYIEAEVRQGTREYACTLVDMIARRLRVAFLNVQITEEMLPHIANIMAEELKWSKDKKSKQIKAAREFLTNQMGRMSIDNTNVTIPIKMSVRQVEKYAAHFRSLDDLNTGYVPVNKCCKAMQGFGLKEVPVDLMHNVLRDIDVHSQGRVNLYEFLLLMSAVVHGDTAYLRYAKLHVDQRLSLVNQRTENNDIPVERSGGGL